VERAPPAPRDRRKGGGGADCRERRHRQLRQRLTPGQGSTPATPAATSPSLRYLAASSVASAMRCRPGRSVRYRGRRNCLEPKVDRRYFYLNPKAIGYGDVATPRPAPHRVWRPLPRARGGAMASFAASGDGPAAVAPATRAATSSIVRGRSAVRARAGLARSSCRWGYPRRERSRAHVDVRARRGRRFRWGWSASTAAIDIAGYSGPASTSRSIAVARRTRESEAHWVWQGG